MPGPYPSDATIEEVYSSESFEADTAMIRTPQDPELDGKFTQFLFRFSYAAPKDGGKLAPSWFILALLFFHSFKGLEGPRVYLYFDNNENPTPFLEILDIWRRPILSETPNIRLLGDSPVSLEVRLWVVELSQRQGDGPTHSTPARLT